jgi:hypothetical protein
MPQCKSCKASIVYLPTRTGKHNPVDVSSLSTIEIQMYISDAVYFNEHLPMFDHTRHLSHFATCPDAKRYRTVKEAVKG